MKDTLSVCSFRSLTELLYVAAELNAEKLVATQSLEIALGSNLFRPTLEPWEDTVSQFLAAEIKINPPRSREDRLALAVAVFQGHQSYAQIMMQLAVDYFMQTAPKFGFAELRSVVTENERVLDQPTAGAYLACHHPQLLKRFERGEFNSASSGPVGRPATAKSVGVPDGGLRVRGVQYHLELARTGALRELSPVDGILMRVQMPPSFMVPSEFLRLSAGFCVKPFAGPHTVLKYLARYTHRVAISNSRILDYANGQVTFLYRDKAQDNARRFCRLKLSEFLRRFLLHTLPHQFVRIRHYGFLANSVRKHRLALLKIKLGRSPYKVQELQPPLCRCCGKPTLKHIAEILPSGSSLRKEKLLPLVA
jgi:hypothetical protein